MSNINQNSISNHTLNPLVFWYPIISAVVILVASNLGTPISILINLFLFIRDRNYLKESGAFVPHWGWFFITPVYIYKRQNRNGLSKKYFWYYILMNILVIIGIVILTALIHPSYPHY